MNALNSQISLLVAFLMFSGSAATAQLPVAVSFEINIPTMTTRYSWKQNNRKAEIENSIRGDVVNALGREFDFWRFVEAAAEPTAAKCKISLVEEGQSEALLELKCQPQSDCNGSREDLRLTARLWAPSEFGAGCAKPAHEIQSKLPAEILTRLLAEETRHSRIEEWLKACVPIGSKGEWDQQGDEGPPRVHLPLPQTLRCSWFELHCKSTEGHTTLHVKGIDKSLPHPSSTDPRHFVQIWEALPHRFYFAGYSERIIGAVVETPAATFVLREMQPDKFYLIDDAGCSGESGLIVADPVR